MELIGTLKHIIFVYSFHGPIIHAVRTKNYNLSDSDGNEKLGSRLNLLSGCQVGEEAFPDGFAFTEGCHNYTCTAGSLETVSVLSTCKDHSCFVLK